MDAPNDCHPLFDDKCASALPPRFSYDLQQRRRHSLQQPPTRQRPLSLSLSNRADLNSRIADSFQEFSVMLQQFSVPQPKTPPPQRRNATSPLNRESRWSVASLPSLSSTSTLMSPSSAAFSLPQSPTTVCPKPVDSEHDRHPPPPWPKPPSPPREPHEFTESSVHPLSNAALASSRQQDASHHQILQRLVRAVCQGDCGTVSSILCKDCTVQPDDPIDEHGWTPLMYAACFGHTQVARTLLDDAGAHIDLQDKKGWTALVWAASRRHNDDMVSLLLERGASHSIRSLAGYSPCQLADVAMEPLLPHDARLLRRRQPRRRQTEPASAADQSNMTYYNTDMYSYSSDVTAAAEADDMDAWRKSLLSLHRFDWDRCRPDQMFVFCQNDVSHILEAVVSDTKLPLHSQDDLWIPANVIFLCCRYAHYHSMRELTQQFLNLAIVRISKTVKAGGRNLHVLAFWISNMCQLLVYLKRDTKLAVSTWDQQRQIQALATDVFDNLLCGYCERVLDKPIESSMLDYEEACGLEPVEYVDDRSWQRRMSFRRSSSSIAPPPSTLITCITDILDTLASYRVHADIQHQLVAHCLECVVTKVFDRMITTKKHLSRSKAIQVRMNVSTLEEWARPHDLGMLFRRITQLLQFLQCVSQLHELQVFQDTVRQFDLLTPSEIRHVVLNYRYEVGEPQLPSTMPLLSEDNNTRGEETKHNTLHPRTPFSLPPIDIMSKRRHDDFPHISEHWVARLDSKK